MSSSDKRSIPPPGISLDYKKVFAVGSHGPIDEKAAAEILSAELNPRFHESGLAIQKSWLHLQKSRGARDFLRAYAAIREVTQVYPTATKNWHSGERIPLRHAEEVATDAVVLAFQAHYKSAYQTLREVIEMVVLQAYFYKAKDKSVVDKWGRGEIKTPGLRNMLKEVKKDALFQAGDEKLDISNNLLRVYDDLGAYVHTRGVPTISMGLVGSNVLTFTPDALDRFFALFTSVSHRCVIFIAIFFPAAIIEVPAFAKFGHFDSIWLPRRDKVNCIRSVLSEAELKVLEDLAGHNAWFQEIIDRVNSLPDLTAAQIEETYERFTILGEQGPEKLIQALKEVNKVLE